MAGRRGRLIAFEGGEASGKSTQARLLAAAIGAELTFEVGATSVGQRIRRLLLDPGVGQIEPRAEALLVAADRAQHVAEVIGPALARGVDVVTDRFDGSTLAYQGYGRGLDVSELARLSSWAAAGVAPDLVVFLDVPPEVAATRVGDAARDRMEAAGAGFHERVAEGYRAIAAADPARWVRVDGTGTVEGVAAKVREAVAVRLGEPGWHA